MIYLLRSFSDVHFCSLDFSVPLIKIYIDFSYALCDCKSSIQLQNFDLAAFSYELINYLLVPVIFQFYFPSRVTHCIKLLFISSSLLFKFSNRLRAPIILSSSIAVLIASSKVNFIFS